MFAAPVIDITTTQTRTNGHAHDIVESTVPMCFAVQMLLMVPSSGTLNMWCLAPECDTSLLQSQEHALTSAPFVYQIRSVLIYEAEFWYFPQKNCFQREINWKWCTCLIKSSKYIEINPDIDFVTEGGNGNCGNVSGIKVLQYSVMWFLLVQSDRISLYGPKRTIHKERSNVE